MGLGRGWACIGFKLTQRLGPDDNDRPSGAAWAEWGRVGLSGVGEGLGLPGDAIKLL